MRILNYALLVMVFFIPLSANAADQNDYQKLEVPEVNFEESYFTGNKMHMYLGLGSLVAAGLTGLTAPDGEGVTTTNQPSKNTAHAYFADATLALAGAAIVSGLYLHWEDVNVDNGFMDPDNLHMILTILGSAAYAYAIVKAPSVIGGSSNGHSSAGIAGGALMLTGIAFEW